jgi:predicted nucleotidyltransferase
MADILNKLFLEKTHEEPFDVNLYIKDTPPLTDEEFARMMAQDNTVYSVL